MYSETFDGLVDNLDKYLAQLRKLDLRLGARKVILYAKKIVFCGREISEGTWTFEKKYWDKVLKIDRPTKLHELSQVIYLAQWLSNAVPKFAHLRDKFTDFVASQGMTKKDLG